MADGSIGYRAALVRRQLTPGLISSLPETAGLLQFFDTTVVATVRITTTLNKRRGVYQSVFSGLAVGYTEMCIQGSEVGRAEVDGIKSHLRRSCHQRAFYSSGVACTHIESLPTRSAVEVIRRPYKSSLFSALYRAHSFSVRLVTSGEAIPNRRNDRIVARTLMLCRC